MTPIAQRLAGIAASLPADQKHIAAELSAVSVEISRLERSQQRPADLLPFARPGIRGLRTRGDDPKGAA